MAVTRVNENMERFFRTMQLGGCCTEDQMRSFLNDKQIEELRREGMLKESTQSLTRKTLKQLHNDNAVSDDTYNRINSQKIPNINTISPSPKCRRFCDKIFGLKDMHSSNTSFHDIKIFSKVMTLSDKEIESAKTESEFRKDLKKTIVAFRNNEETKEIYRAKMDEMNERYRNFEKYFNRKCEYGSPADLSYRSEKTGKYVAYEVVTKHYSEFDKMVKEFSAFVMEYEYEEVAI